MILKGKTIAVGVSGGIAAYKSCELVSSLKKLGAQVFVVMTNNACRFVSPLTFETLSNNKVFCDMFNQNRSSEVEHISIAKRADLFVIAPCTANVAGKIANGIADDFLTTVVMATTAPVLIAPAMNTNMIQSAAYCHNRQTLTLRGYHFVEADTGLLACGDIGLGRLAEIPKIIEEIIRLLNVTNDFAGKRVLVTAGATREFLDPVRYITNRSSGKMGLSIAAAAAKRGADVTVVAGYLSAQIEGSYKVVNVSTTDEMLKEVTSAKNFDYYIMAAAPCDYKIKAYSKQKIKNASITAEFTKNPDIAAEIGKNKGESKLIIFAAETENLIENAKLKLINKNADMVIANDVTAQNAGFDVDTNVITIITKGSNSQNQSQTSLQSKKTNMAASLTQSQQTNQSGQCAQFQESYHKPIISKSQKSDKVQAYIQSQPYCGKKSQIADIILDNVLCLQK